MLNQHRLDLPPQKINRLRVKFLQHDPCSQDFPRQCRRVCEAQCSSLWQKMWKSGHGKARCDNRLPAERSKSERSVPTILCACARGPCVFYGACVCVCVCVYSSLWIIFNSHSCWDLCTRIQEENQFGSSEATVISNLHNTQWAGVCVCVCVCVCVFGGLTDWPFGRDLSLSRGEHA